MIKYYFKSAASTPTWRTQKFGNLLSDTYQGEVYQSDDGTWVGWFFNWSDSTKNDFRFGFKSKGVATRWVNQKLRAVGVR